MSKSVGQVKWYDQVKGYGFIKVDGREKDIFFHAKQWNLAALNSLPVDGETLHFTIEEGPKGAFAKEIVRAA
jgi:cold shock protein